MRCLPDSASSGLLSAVRINRLSQKSSLSPTNTKKVSSTNSSPCKFQILLNLIYLNVPISALSALQNDLPKMEWGLRPRSKHSESRDWKTRQQWESTFHSGDPPSSSHWCLPASSKASSSMIFWFELNFLTLTNLTTFSTAHSGLLNSSCIQSGCIVLSVSQLLLQCNCPCIINSEEPSIHQIWIFYLGFKE